MQDVNQFPRLRGTVNNYNYYLSYAMFILLYITMKVPEFYRELFI